MRTTIGGPLRGRRVLVTRSRAQASRLSAGLEELGATVVEVPALEFMPLPTPELPRLVSRLRAGDWIVLTSSNGVRYLASALAETDVELGTDVQVAVSGEASARAAQEAGFGVSLVPERFVAESLVEALSARGVAGKRVLLARNRDGRELLARALADSGADVLDLELYASRPPAASRQLLKGAEAMGVDAITAASSNTIRFFDRLLSPSRREHYRSIPVVSIGPITSETVRSLGYTLGAEADPCTIEGLVMATRRLLDR